ncbi:hypothetical protein GYMLUDRAFT_48061 [Collybiopsis luxurians FD-317 M1]|uniref:THUMP domain-containing protein n=1 Tax=Collybiopsis luxurians FD-317 M1 TaxID=944289 RepID=A0A0D0BK78_9AGAR|nr:hypothetical protein GYMLUDRAFT_48061 [Collybiopsis luxurians FD-317 M1]
MADSKRKLQSSDKRRKRKYISDGMSSKKSVDGPGVWVSCVKGKEKQTVGELYDLFESIAAKVWPMDDSHSDNSSDDDQSREESGLSIEDQINTEVTAFKRPRSQQRFASCQTNTPCVVFISCRPPVDPVQLVETHIRNVKSTGITRTRYTHRFVPVAATCYTNLSDMQALCKTIFGHYFSQNVGDSVHTYKIELRMRNHTTLARDSIIQAIAECVPEKFKVDLTAPEFFVLVEIFKSVCGISITRDYYKLHKYNVMELAKELAKGSEEGSRISQT